MLASSTSSPPSPSSEPGSLVVSYMTLRRALGVLGVSFPFVLALGDRLLFDATRVAPSISAYHYTPMRDVFAGVLFAIGLFLFAYKGYERRDDLAGDLACAFALGVALFPTAPEPTPDGWPTWVGALHLSCAAALFLTLSYFCLRLFTLGAPDPTPRKRQRNVVYRVCGVTMLACIGLIGVWFWVLEARAPELAGLSPVFWLESVAIVAFGVSWLVKGEAVLADAAGEGDGGGSVG